MGNDVDREEVRDVRCDREAVRLRFRRAGLERRESASETVGLKREANKDKSLMTRTTEIQSFTRQIISWPI